MKPVRFSDLNYMALSPAHYRAHISSPAEETDAMRVGSAVHGLVLGSGRPIAVWYGGRRQGKAWDEFCLEHTDDLILTSKQYDLATAMAGSVMACPEAAGLFEGRRECRAEWELAGFHCAGTPDVAGEGFITDLKTTCDANPERFIRDAMRRFYHVQLAWYLDGLNWAATRRGEHDEVHSAFLVAVESKPPHVVTVFELGHDALDLGRRIHRQWLERLRVCIDSDEWPGYVQCRVPFTLPDWLPGMADDDEPESDSESPADEFGLSLS